MSDREIENIVDYVRTACRTRPRSSARRGSSGKSAARRSQALRVRARAAGRRSLSGARHFAARAVDRRPRDRRRARDDAAGRHAPDHPHDRRRVRAKSPRPRRRPISSTGPCSPIAASKRRRTRSGSRTRDATSTSSANLSIPASAPADMSEMGEDASDRLPGRTPTRRPRARGAAAGRRALGATRRRHPRNPAQGRAGGTAAPSGALFWSGLAAGLSMGFSFLTLAYPGQRSGRSLAEPRRQLRLRPRLRHRRAWPPAALHRIDADRRPAAAGKPEWPELSRSPGFWAIVLAANLLGTFVFAGLLSIPALFPGADARRARRDRRERRRRSLLAEGGRRACSPAGSSR